MPDYVVRRPEDRDPRQYADQIRELVAEIWRRAQEWHDRSGWVDNEHNSHRYQVTHDVVADLDAMQEDEVPSIVEAATRIDNRMENSLCRSRATSLCGCGSLKEPACTRHAWRHLSYEIQG
jgi:hypothetical protein